MDKLFVPVVEKVFARIDEKNEAFNVAFEQRFAAERAAPVRPKKPLERFRIWLATPRPSKVMIWTPAQLGAFLDYAAGDRLYALYHLIAFRGLRRGEACGAQRVDLDLDESTLLVAKQLSNVGKAVKEGAPKTDSSDAPIALDSGTVAALRANEVRQLEEQRAWGEGWQDSGRIFTREDGTELTPDWVSEHFERLAFAAGLPPIRLHDLRHCAATLSLAAGNDMKTTSAMLRHSSQGITSDLYTTVLPELAEASVALVPRAAATTEASHTGGLPRVSQRENGRPPDSDGAKKPQVECGIGE